MARGVFSLNRVYKKQFQNVNDGNFESWPESATYGYFGGGQDGSTTICTINRLDYQVEVVSDPGNSNLSIDVRSTGSVQTSLYGFYVGGYDSVNSHSQVDRLDFSTEVVSDPGTKLPDINQSMGSFENNSYGYFTGGRVTPTSNYRSSIDRLDFTTETCAPTPIGDLPNTNASNSGLQTNDYGYIAGGSFFPPLTRYDDIFRFQFSNETVSTPTNLTGVLSNNIQGTYTTQCPQYGYIAGGNSFFSPDVYRSNIERLDFSNETVQLMPNKIFGQFGYGGYSSSSTYGYMFCGINDQGPSSTSTMSRINFSNETVATVSPFPFSGYSLKRGLSGGQSQRPKGSRTYGYFAGGVVAGAVYQCTIERLDFSNETASDLGDVIPVARQTTAVTTGSYGYFGGGEIFPPTSTWYSIVERFDLSNETASSLGNILSESRARIGAVYSSSYGYFAGGRAPDTTFDSVIDRLDFSNETMTSPGNLSGGVRSGSIGASFSNYGYLVGGKNNPTSEICSVERLDFSTEVTSSPSLEISQARDILSSLFNNSYGYFAGGRSTPPTYSSIVDRLDFSNNTATSLTPLPDAKTGMGGVSSNYYGYLAAGFSPGYVCVIERLDFSTETLTPSVSTLPRAKSSSAGLSN